MSNCRVTLSDFSVKIPVRGAVCSVTTSLNITGLYLYIPVLLLPGIDLHLIKEGIHYTDLTVTSQGEDRSHFPDYLSTFKDVSIPGMLYIRTSLCGLYIQLERGGVVQVDRSIYRNVSVRY